MHRVIPKGRCIDVLSIDSEKLEQQNQFKKHL